MQVMQTRRTFTKALVAFGLCGSMLGGLAASVGRAQDQPAPKPEHLEKMQQDLPADAPAKPKKERKVLVYGLANGFVHSSIPLGQATIAALGEKVGAYKSVVSNDPSVFDEDKLKEFDAVILVSTTSRFLLPRTPDTNGKSEEEKQAAKKAAEESLKPYKEAEARQLQNLVDFVKKQGKGLVGIHVATDAYYENREYGELIGGYFNAHPWNEKVGLKIEDPDSPLTAMFEKKGYDVADEIYQFTPKGKDKDGREKQTYTRDRSRVLTSLDMTPGRTAPKGNSPTNDYPVTWVHKAGGGRVFYCSLGHREEIFWNPTILKHYLAGIQWAMGDLEADATPSAVKTATSGK